MASRKVNDAKAKAKKQKIIAIGGSVVLLAVLAFGIAFFVPEHGIVSIYLRGDSGGLMFRRLFLPLILIGLGVKIPQLRFFGPYVCRGANSRRCVALTFDDGPDPRSTPLLLELLRGTGQPAAFFCVGQRVAAHPELAARIVREGHLLENHSYTHSDTTNLFTVARLRAELEQTQAAIRQAAGVAPRCFRPPMGLSNPRVFRAAARGTFRRATRAAPAATTTIPISKRAIWAFGLW